MSTLKKVPKKQLEKYSTVFMQLGLLVTLFVVYVLLEHQTEKKIATAIVFDVAPSNSYMLDENVIFVKEKPKQKVIKKRPSKKLILDIVPEIKEDNRVVETNLPDDMVEENKIETALNNMVADPTDIIIEDVPFISVEEAPVFKGCEGLSIEDNKKCFDKKMKKFVQRNFNVDLSQDLGLQQGKHKIVTQFIIDKSGNVIGIKVRAPHKRLQLETIKLIKKLPQFTPGKQHKKPVKVRYILPITFRVE